MLLRGEAGRGELLLSAIDPFVLGNKGSALIHEMLHNLGARFNGRPRHIRRRSTGTARSYALLSPGTYAGEHGRGHGPRLPRRHSAADLRPGAVTPKTGAPWTATKDSGTSKR